MNVQFTIIDYTTNPLGDATEIDEPIGWDAINFHLKRDENWHGFFDFVDDALGSLQFDGASFNILKTAYETYGIEAYIELKVSFQCAEAEPVNTLYLGKFVFSRYKAYCGDRCYIEIGLEAVPSLMNFRNRIDQQVDLDALASYDTTPTSQVIKTSATFVQTNRIQLRQILNGVVPGSQITIADSAHNNGTYTVVSAVPNFSSLQSAFSTRTPFAQPPTSANITLLNDTKSVYVSLNITALSIGSTITTVTAANGTLHLTVVACTNFYNYTLITVAESFTDETDDAGTIQGTFALADGLPFTDITILQNSMVNENAANCTVTAVFPANNLLPYRGLSTQISLPGKSIFYTSRWQNTFTKVYNLDMWKDISTDDFSQSDTFLAFTPDFANIQSEIEETDVATNKTFRIDQGPVQTVNNNYSATNPPETVVYFHPISAIACGGSAVFSFRMKGKFEGQNGCSMAHNAFLWHTFVFVADTEYGFYGSQTRGPRKWEYEIDPNGFDISDTVTLPHFEPGMYLWPYLRIRVVNRDGSNPCSPAAVLSPESFWQLEVHTTCSDTSCPVYMVNESMSRCVENYTNDDIRVYSDYFGRPDAQPYTSAGYGCGSKEAITSGLKIRGSTMPTGQAVPKFTASMQELFDSLNAIHNIGMGLEDDPHRAGNKLLRVEPLKYFFNDTLLLSCNSVKEANLSVNEKMLASGFKCGYQQFETWNNNGLYDIFGERSYRTTLNELNNEVDRTCKYVASDYAIEFTRRFFGLTTSDSRYDNNTFILCLTNENPGRMIFFPRSGAVLAGVHIINYPKITAPNPGDTIVIVSSLNSGTYTVDHCLTPIDPSLPVYSFTIFVIASQNFVTENDVPATIMNVTNPFYSAEQGIPNPANVIEPQTVLNYRISPAHNAMRHFKTIVNSYRDYTNGEMIFTSGKGNFYAMGQLTDSCKMEGVPLSESANIKRSLFNDADEATPLFRPETVKFEYPLSFNDFLTIYANPYGLIEFQCGSAPAQQGWIEDLQYKPYTGMAEFVLRPRI